MAFGPTGHSYEPLREKLTQIIDQAVGLSPLQFGMSLQVAQDMAAREDSLDSAIRDNRQLVDVIAAHDLKGSDSGSVSRDRPELTHRAHHTLHACLHPALVVHSLNLVRSDEPGHLAILHDHEAATSTAQQMFVDEVLQTKNVLLLSGSRVP